MQRISPAVLQEMKAISKLRNGETTWLRVVHSGYGQEPWRAAVADSARGVRGDSRQQVHPRRSPPSALWTPDKVAARRCGVLRPAAAAGCGQRKQESHGWLCRSPNVFRSSYFALRHFKVQTLFCRVVAINHIYVFRAIPS